MSKVVATITPSAARRAFAIALLIGLGLMLVYLAFAASGAALGWQGLLLGIGMLLLILADKMRRATRGRIEMTDTVLRDGAGREICRLDDIVSVERGVFAFKPAQGFLIRTVRRAKFAWEPGLWWRVGRKIGVGGVTSAGQSKYMAELIALRLQDKGAKSAD